MNDRGSIEVICGSMFSGKTEELLRRIRRAQIARIKTQLFKPQLDDRYSLYHVQSHNSSRMPSTAIQRAEEVLERLEDHTRVVGIDEAQFFDASLIPVIQKLAYRGILVLVAGLDMDYLGRPFGPMPQLLAIAERVTKLSAVCVQCGEPASRTQRLASSQSPSHSLAPSVTPDAAPVHIGASESYEARCRFCHDPELSSQALLPLSGLHRSPTLGSKEEENLWNSEAREPQLC